MRWRNEKISENDLAHEPGLRPARTYQPGLILLPNRHKLPRLAHK